VINLGSAAPLSLNVYDQNGNPANATTVLLTITQPDTTTLTPAVTNPPATAGAYFPAVPFVPTQPGRHLVSWVTTAPNTGYTDTFDVAEANPPSILSLADIKQQLGILPANTADDAELLQWGYTTTQIIENYKHEVIAQRTIAEIHGYPNTLPFTGYIDYGPQLRLQYPPIIALVSAVAENGSYTWTIPGNFDVDAYTGLITCINGPPIAGRVILTYTAGYVIVPYNYLIGCRMLLQHLWESRRGPGGASGMMGPEELSDFRHYTSLPRKVTEMLGPARPVVA
jgi:hypothetical protein